MAFGDPEVTVDIVDGEDGKIIYKDESGMAQTFYPARSIWLTIDSLELLTALSESADDVPATKLITRIKGVATLEDFSVSVIGSPETKSRSLSISLEAGEWLPKEADPSSLRYAGKLGGAMLSFNRADWEAGTSDEWWISCYVAKEFIDSLVADIRGESIREMKVMLTLADLYGTSDSWAPLSLRDHLFIRPTQRDSRLNIPQVAQGYVSSLHFSSAKRDLRPVKPAEPQNDDEEVVSAQVVPANSQQVQSEALRQQIEKLRVTVKWVGGLIALMLFFIAAR
ncbi:hypothetical protein [Rhodoferax mekongensis]|uniref:hypothetical protein n=1 Tax=Rhodoferax mekongensis TaxID=3068341 RepID=UPI0028BEC8F4|nr:hypothetical protein [Rhodoferax sp. TBRC 17199]MDT7514688.1 hypothetical protein [Rhodoferax sp. TBRC 17199]